VTTANSETLQALAAGAKLKRVGKRQPLLAYIADTWQRRSFASALARYQLEASTAKSSLGVAWLVLVPALQVTVYGLIFGVLLGSSRPANFLPYMISGIVLFQYLQGVFSDGAKSITGNYSLVRSLNFPRMLLPVSSVLSNIYRSLPIVGLMLITLAVLGEPVRATWFLIIPVFALMTVFGTGLALLSARLTVHLADLNQLIPFITRVAFYVSGVFASVDKIIAEYPSIAGVMIFNPVHSYLVIARGALVSGYTANAIDWWVAVTWAFGTLGFGLVFFWLAEERYGRNV
jgi:teichoic acid transport system permease protein